MSSNFAKTFGSSDLATTMAVADGIANGIIGNSTAELAHYG
jgi:hypothetical protein